MGSSYTWCNSKEVTPFLDHWFLWDLMVKNSQLPHQQNLFKGIFLSLTLFITTIDFSLLIYLFISFFHPFYITTWVLFFFFSGLIQYNFLLFHPSCYGDLWHNITVLHPVTCIAYSHTYTHTYIYIYIYIYIDVTGIYLKQGVGEPGYWCHHLKLFMQIYCL